MFSIEPSLPGMQGTLYLRAVRFASTLSPIAAIVSDRGPMKMNPLSVTSFANLGFSERNPTPGWMASTWARLAAEIILFILRYEDLDEAGPTQTASSARRTGRLCLSASEKTTTDRIPISLQARITRTAISPRLAMRMDLIIFCEPRREARRTRPLFRFQQGSLRSPCRSRLQAGSSPSLLQLCRLFRRI